MKRFLAMAIAAGTMTFGGGVYEAQAASPLGKTYKAPSGRHIKVSKCGGGLGMRIVKSKVKSQVGKRIMCGAKKTGANSWAGTILNVDDGKKYSGKASLSGRTLTVGGCVLGGLICKNQAWSQVK